LAKIKTALEDFQPDIRLLDERGPTNERARRGDNPISTALHKGQITPGQYATAQKLYTHWFHGGCAGTVHSKDLSAVFVSFRPTDGLATTEWAAFHRRSFLNAIQALNESKNPKYLYVVPRVVLWDEPIETVTEGLRNIINMRWRNRPQSFVVAVEALRDGLDLLGREWGIST
jgi:hypothetical protein